jgi:uncharacterized membrane protein YiaA
MRIVVATEFRKKRLKLASDAGQKALDSAADFIKVTTGLATGALVFSVGLTNAPSGLNTPARYLLATSWIALLVSLLFGVFVAQGRITTKMAERSYDIHGDRWLTIPTMAHQWAFFLGVALLGATLAVVVAQQPPTNNAKVLSAMRAVQIAENNVPKFLSIVKVSTVEFVKGAEPTDASIPTWHIQFQVAHPLARKNKRSELPVSDYLDIFVDPESGEALVAPQLRVTRPASKRAASSRCTQLSEWGTK